MFINTFLLQYWAELTGWILVLHKMPSVGQEYCDKTGLSLHIRELTVVTTQPQPTLQWPLLLGRRPAPPSSSPVCRYVWQRRGWCEGFWTPWRCPADEQQRRSYCSGPGWTWWCTTPDTGRTGKETKWDVDQNPSVQSWYQSTHSSTKSFTQQSRELIIIPNFKLTLSVNTTPIFQTRYFVSIELNLEKKKGWYDIFYFFAVRSSSQSAFYLSNLSPWHQWSLLGDSFLCRVEIQGTLIQPQQFCYPLCPIQVSVLFDHLQNSSKTEMGRGWHCGWHLVNITRLCAWQIRWKLHKPLTLRLTNLSQ